MTTNLNETSAKLLAEIMRDQDATPVSPELRAKQRRLLEKLKNGTFSTPPDWNPPQALRPSQRQRSEPSSSVLRGAQSIRTRVGWAFDVRESGR